MRTKLRCTCCGGKPLQGSSKCAKCAEMIEKDAIDFLSHANSSDNVAIILNGNGSLIMRSKPYMETKNPFDRHPPTEEPSIEQELLSFIQLVATPKRPDGTYNYCREALEVKAKDLLANIARKGLPLMGVNSRIFS